MRIVGGIFSGRRFNPPASTPARPTTDASKEALFNTLVNMMDIEGISACDIFGGTGSISYELLSRGAAEVTVVERDMGNINFIKKTSKELGIADKLKIVKGDVFRFMKQSTGQYDFIFADPPYDLPNIDDIPMLVFEQDMLAAGGIFVLEHPSRKDYQSHPRFRKMKNYGTTVFSYFTQPSE
jgi:16S rRNA (guanine966-N2)-methyltransferase